MGTFHDPCEKGLSENDEMGHAPYMIIDMAILIREILYEHGDFGHQILGDPIFRESHDLNDFNGCQRCSMLVDASRQYF